MTPRAGPPQPVAAPASQRVDLSVLRGLVGDDEATLAEFLVAFLDALATQGGEVVEACRAGDGARMARAAHKLKSSSRSMGAMGLGDLCAELEAAGKAGAGTAVLAAACARFERAASEVRAATIELLGAPGA